MKNQEMKQPRLEQVQAAYQNAGNSPEIQALLSTINDWAAEDKRRSVIVIVSESRTVDEKSHALSTTVGICGHRNLLVESLQDAIRHNKDTLASFISEATAKLFVEKILKKANNE